jgi:hypothetical protein
VSLFSKVFLSLGVFLIAAGIGYGRTAYEHEGFTLMIIVAGGALLIGVYLAYAVQRARAALSERDTAARLAAEEAEPHITPTIWPLVFALSMIGLVVGAVASRWAFVGGGALLVVAGLGWVLDVRRQWRHHPAAEPEGAAHDQAPEAQTG